MEYLVTATALGATVPSRGSWLVQAECRAEALKMVLEQDTTHWWPAHTRWTVKPRPGMRALRETSGRASPSVVVSAPR